MRYYKWGGELRKSLGARSKFRYATTSSDDELDTVSFVLAVLKQHEKELDRLVSKLGKITRQLRETDKLVLRVEELDNELENFRSEISNITKCRPFNK